MQLHKAFATGGLALSICVAAFAQTTAIIQGTVLVGDRQHPLHKATVILIPANRTATTNEQGEYRFANVAPGTYSVVVHSAGLGDQRQPATVAGGAILNLDFVLQPAPVRESVVVTATGGQETTVETIASTTSLDSVQIVQRAGPALGEALDNEPGVTQRGFGPGSSQPVIRGFSGDRVLVMQDGQATGSLASQSGDHGEPIDVLNLERLEVVRGPATLLYGSSAIGGVVNAISGNFQHDENTHPGLSGYFTGLGGTTNDNLGASGKLTYTFDEHWKAWAGANGQHTEDYDTPIGTIPNSHTRNYGGTLGFGYTSKKGFFDVGYQHDNRKYGIPFAVFLESGGAEGGFADPEGETTNIRQKTHDIRADAGLRDLDGWISGMQANVNFTHYRHGEFEGEAAGTQFKNDQFNYRVTFDQKKYKRLSGSFGVSGLQRSFEATGEEAIAPPTDQKSFSVFGLQKLDFDRVSFQFGGRFERNDYNVDEAFLPVRQDRSFNGGSAAVGGRVALWKGGAFVANYTHSFRSPALEELYNFGPHPGNLSFEIGSSQLKPEVGNGIDLSIRQEATRFHADISFFNYQIGNYIFLAPDGLLNGGLIEAEYLQGDTRYFGGEASLGVALLQNLWLLGSVDGVSATLTNNVASPTTASVIPVDTPLPRIPPVRGKLSLDWRYKNFGLTPEVVMASSQENLFVNETRTFGYTTFGLGASYTIAKSHAVHVFSLNAFNLGDRLYRNHISFIKDFVPEIGRGVRFSYTVRFF